jgi:hypothetical protein
MVEQAGEDRPGKALFQLQGRYPAIELGAVQLKCSYHHPRYFVAAPSPCHRHLLNCYAVSWISSWLSPVRGARHGKDARYFVLYNAHMGVPVRQNEVSHRTLCFTTGCIYWKGCSTKSHVICWSIPRSN